MLSKHSRSLMKRHFGIVKYSIPTHSLPLSPNRPRPRHTSHGCYGFCPPARDRTTASNTTDVTNGPLTAWEKWSETRPPQQGGCVALRCVALRCGGRCRCRTELGMRVTAQLLSLRVAIGKSSTYGSLRICATDL